MSRHTSLEHVKLEKVKKTVWNTVIFGRDLPRGKACLTKQTLNIVINETKCGRLHLQLQTEYLRLQLLFILAQLEVDEAA